MRPVVPALGLVLVLAGAALAQPALDAMPTSIELAPGDERVVRLSLTGTDERGGVYDLFASASDVRVAFPDDQQTRGILLLPGAQAGLSWTPTIRAPEGLEDGARDITFRLIERPGPPSPRTFDATIRVRVAAPDAARASISPVAASPSPGEPLPIAAVAFAALGVVVMVAASWRRLAWPFATLYWRTRPERLLDHPVRARLVDAIRVQPGIARADLQRRLELADGQLDHHLRRLLAARIVVKVEQDGARLLYLAGAERPASTRAEERILSALAGSVGLTARGVAERVGLTPKHARYYLQKLARSGRVSADEGDGAQVYRVADQTGR